MNGSKTLENSWVIKLVLINILVFFVQIIIAFFYNFRIEQFLGLSPRMVSGNFWLWQVFTYMFLHSPENFFHILFNMYLLWVFGLAVEEEWGPKTFFKYYIFSGVGAGLCILLLNYFKSPWSLTIGASGAIFAVLLAFGLLYPNSEILLFFVLPLKAKYLVVLYGGLELFLMVSSSGDNVSHIGHLGGLLFGLIYFLSFKRQYIFKTDKSKKQVEILGEIKKKVEEIREKTSKHSQSESVKNALAIKQKFDVARNPELDENEKKFLAMLLQGYKEEYKNYICKKEDFSVDDPYCQKSEYFNFCLHRFITGQDPKKGMDHE
jgi:membrane associated rhomboid family serine protease